MYLKRIFLALLPLLLLTGCGDDDPSATDGPDSKQQEATQNTNRNQTNVVPQAWRLEFPRLKGGDNLVIVHSTANYGVNYSLEWNPSKNAQRWSCYQMYAANSVANTSRYYSKDNQYPQDPQLPREYQLPGDPFWNSGYDHGHICPSADRLCSYEANVQTFYLTNMQPQRNVFNAGLWSKMEGQVRTWNRGNFRDTLYVCKGGTIDKEEHIIKYLGSGLSKIPVPRYFFMALLCKNSDGYKALGFWAEHSDYDHSTDRLADYVVNIDQLEELTGIDFFCNLPDAIENRIESLPLDNVRRAWGMN